MTEKTNPAAGTSLPDREVGKMRVRKTILKTCAVLMAAAMAASPITVRAVEFGTPDGDRYEFDAESAIPADAVNGIAERGIAYKMPSYDWNEFGEMAPGELRVFFFDGDSYDYDFGRAVPAGYKKVQIEVWREWLGNDGSYGYYEVPNRGWYIDADNSKDWSLVPLTFDNSSCAGGVSMFDFTVDCDGVTYPDCWGVIGDLELTILHAQVVVPQQYDGAIPLTIYGMKNENGELTQDDTSYITVYLQGGNGSTAQPSAPAADPQPAVPAADPTADPQPAVPASAPAADPQPAVPVADPQPVTTQQQGTVYVTKSGDNLMKIAKELYGDRNLWTTIYELNKDIIKNPNVIYANMQLQLP